MTKKALIIAAVAATLTSGAAFAQTYDRDHRNDNRYEQQDRSYRTDRNDYGRHVDNNDRRDRWDRHDRNDRRDNNYRGHEHRDYRYNNSYGNGYGVVYNSGYNNAYRYGVRRGEYLPHQYRGSRYVVSDWHGRRHLYAPPRGHQWVQAGNDYLLVALATGLIAQVLLSN